MIVFFRKIIFCFRSRIFYKSKLSYFSQFINTNYIFIGKNISIGVRSVLFPIRNYGQDFFEASINIGDNVYIGHNTQLHCIGRMEIGQGSVISDYVYISDVAHGMSPTEGPIMKQLLYSKGAVIIGENCFIGYGVSVLPGVTLGKHCIVSTRAVVTKSFPDYSMLAGNPARLIKIFDVESNSWVSV